MNIAFFCSDFNRSSIIAQPWKHIYEIARRMMALGNQVYVLTDEFLGLPKYEEIDGLPVCRIKKGRFLLNQRNLLENLNKNNIDLINWHSGLMSAIYFWRLQKFIKNDVVWTVHTGKISCYDRRNLRFSDLKHLDKFWNNILYSICPNSIFKRGANASPVKKIITSSKRLETYFQNIGIPKKKITTISSGADTNIFRPLSASNIYDQKKKLGFHPQDPIIIYFGPLCRLRGADTVIFAMPKILKEIPSAKLILIARQTKSSFRNEESWFEKIAKRKGGTRLLTTISQKETLIKYLAIANVIVLPFRFWPFIECPLTILEAMAMEKPVITTYAGSIPEIVSDGKTGILVQPGNPDTIAKATIKLLTNEDISINIGARAREYVKKSHDWDAITRRTLNVFRKMDDDI